jgi:D-inositol-3-phosphate glycosyltransferase
VRIALISEHANPLAAIGGVDAGGQNVHVAALAASLARTGVDVDIYTRRDDPSSAPSAPLCPGAVVHHIDAGPAEAIPKDDLLSHMPAFARELRRSFAERPPAVVHAHFWMSGLAALDASGRRREWPVVQTFHALGVVKQRHQGSQDTSPRERIGIERRIVREADRLLATCSDEVFELRRLGADVGRIAIVPCGVDLRLFTPAGPAEPRPAGIRRLVVVSRLVERKGIEYVIRALPALPDVELVVAGGGEAGELSSDPEARRLQAIAREIGVAARVDFRGGMEREALPALYRSADAVCATPWYEPFGMVPLEAMACGVPVVASAVGGLVDTVVHGKTGLHVPPRSEDAIAQAVRQLLADEQWREALGSAAAERARRYGWARIAEATLDAYAETVRQAVGRRARSVRA